MTRLPLQATTAIWGKSVELLSRFMSPFLRLWIGGAGGWEDISRPSLCRGAAYGFVWHQQGLSCGWQGCGELETPHQRSLCRGAAAGEGGGRAVARPLLPTLNGCHGAWLRSDCGMMDYDDAGGPFSVWRKERNKCLCGMEWEDPGFESRCDGADMWTVVPWDGKQPMTPVSECTFQGSVGISLCF